mmetsp:Transcript_33232/g.73494  ORF Transcript_33232/g.73494 Transcript_33232/m.73494 type:complete len:106 (-) Transcript_33232:483-800(-)
MHSEWLCMPEGGNFSSAKAGGSGKLQPADWALQPGAQFQRGPCGGPCGPYKAAASQPAGSTGSRQSKTGTMPQGWRPLRHRQLHLPVPHAVVGVVMSLLLAAVWR